LTVFRKADKFEIKNDQFFLRYLFSDS